MRRNGFRKYGLRPTSRASQDRVSNPGRKKDWWDKAPVITSILSSVLIALVGIYVSSTIQKSQLAVTKDVSHDQIALTRDTSQAQLDVSKQKNSEDAKLEEMKLAKDLLEPLASTDRRKSQAAQAMLYKVVSDHDFAHQIIAVYTSEDQSERVEALKRVGSGKSKISALVLDHVQRNSSLPPSERRLATDLSIKAALNSALPTNSAFLFGSVPGAATYESPKLQGGVFTYFLVDGLSGKADSNGDKKISIGELYAYVDSKTRSLDLDAIRIENRGVRPLLSRDGTSMYKPFLELSGSPDLIVADVDDNGRLPGGVALVVGSNRYPDSFLPLQFAISDAQHVASTLSHIGIRVTLLTDPTKSTLEEMLRTTLASVGPSESFYFYFAGHGWSQSGENFLGPSDLKFRADQLIGGISLEEIKSAIRQNNVKAAFAFLDVCRNELSR